MTIKNPLELFESPIESFGVWIFCIMASILTGKTCSTYFPYLLSSPIYYKVKTKRFQKIFMRQYLNRTLSPAVANEDLNKLPLLACIWYAISFLMLTIGFFLFLLVQIEVIVYRFPIIHFIERIFAVAFPFYLILMPIFPFLYRIDYYLGKRVYH